MKEEWLVREIRRSHREEAISLGKAVREAGIKQPEMAAAGARTVIIDSCEISYLRGKCSGKGEAEASGVEHSHP